LCFFLAHNKKCSFFGPLSQCYISEREREKNELFAPHANRKQRGQKREREEEYHERK